MLSPPLPKVLIAHHGEIARRIQASCHSMGLQTIAVYTKAERGAAYIEAAHEAYELPGEGGAAYMDQDALISIAHKAAIDAVHPGYGFLSERADFAQRVIDEGFLWIGPSPQTIKTMGDKIQARHLAQSLAIPVIPGAHFSVDNAGFTLAQAYAQSISYPVLIKNPLGGGGKAMKVAGSDTDFVTSWQSVIAESEVMGISTPFLVEKYITQGRHIEVQIISDGKQYLHAYERECSLQRRHQKIIEEAPCLFIDQTIKNMLYTWSLSLARAVDYQGVGTIEFLVDQENVFFLEMNTRLQVEHSVTEMITGIDLVHEQLLIAFEKKTNWQQKNIITRGHAIQARIYAEDPYKNYLPSSGTVIGLKLPLMPTVRVDHDLVVGREISPFFDPMIAKITAYGHNREQSINNLQEALRITTIAGITTNISFLEQLLAHERIKSGEIHTKLLTNPTFFATLNQLNNPEAQALQIALAEQARALFLGATAMGSSAPSCQQPDSKPQKPINTRSAWRQQLWN